MGIELLLWSWLSFSLPVQQENIAFAMHKQIQTQATPLSGIASFYHPRFVGRPTATGETFSNNDFTAASNHFKLGTYARITNLRNGKIVYVKINDRMGQPNRVLDLTERSAHALSFYEAGLTKVMIEPVIPEVGKREIANQLESRLAELYVKEEDEVEDNRL